MNQVKFVEPSLEKILLSPFLNTLPHIWHNSLKLKTYSKSKTEILKQAIPDSTCPFIVCLEQASIRLTDT